MRILTEMYVCIFKHSFLKWTVVEKSLTGCSLDQSLSVTNVK